MKSKKSFFNKTIFWKNVTLYWPIWGVYALILMFIQPVVLWISEYNAQYYMTYTDGDHLSNLISAVYMEPHIVMIAFASILIGMALYNYLYNSKSANMIHSLPVDRTQLFFTNLISGVSFLAVPQLLSAILTAIVALCFGITEVHYVGIWFLMVLATDIVAFSIVTFCAMFTGHIVALPVYVFIVNYFVYWVYYILQVTVVSFGYGVTSIASGFEGLLDTFCPLNAFLYNVGIHAKYDTSGNYECIGASVFGWNVIFIYLLVAVALYTAAYLVYRKRHIEQAGEILTVEWVKPIFRFGVGLSGGFFGGMLVREILHALGLRCGIVGFIVLMLLIGAVAYFVAYMLVKKSFHVFKKKNWIGCGIFSVVMLLTFFCMYGVSGMMEVYIPESSEVKSATICMSYDIELEGEDVEVILDIHEDILENRELCEAYLESGNYIYEFVRINYIMEDGRYVSRNYSLPYGDGEIKPIIEKITELERDEENYLAYIFCDNYQDIELFNGGWLEAQFVEGDSVPEDEYMDYSYNTINFTSEEAEALYEAIIADIKAGTLMKYNVYSVGWLDDESGYKYSDAYLMIEFENPNEDQKEQFSTYEDSDGIIYEYEYGSYVEEGIWYSTYLNFGPDCENIVNTLVELGIIESVDDIWWGEMYE